jgi:hypothetical protein
MIGLRQSSLTESEKLSLNIRSELSSLLEAENVKPADFEPTAEAEFAIL